MKYRREIDGLRALAVLPVIFFHAGFERFSGGFVGVDIFFVISGYLITSIIYIELDKGRFSIAKFYERRARRILPALFTVVFASVMIGLMWMRPSDMQFLSRSVAAVATFSSNFLFWSESGYFDVSAELKPLLHTWSLAVEEQFYIIFPPVLIAAHRFGGKFVISLLAAFAVVSIALAQWGVVHQPSASFFLLPARGWELLMGALIALHFIFNTKNEWNSGICNILSAIGLTLIIYSIARFNRHTPFPSVYTLIPTFGTALVIIFGWPNTYVGRLLGSKALVGVGMISYSAYLWHQPLFAFARHRSLHAPGPLVYLTLAALALVLAYLSWRFIELPFRQPSRIKRDVLFKFSLVGSLIFLSIGLAGNWTEGYLFRGGLREAYTPLEYRTRINYGLRDMGFTCIPTGSTALNCRTGDNPEVLLWGDSYADHLAQGLLASKPGLRLVAMTKPGCAPIIGMAPIVKEDPIEWTRGCMEQNDKVISYARSSHSLRFAVLSSPFREIGSNTLLLRSGEIASGKVALQAHLERTLEELVSLGIQPVIFAPPPRDGTDFGRCLVGATMFNEDLSRCDFSSSVAVSRHKDVIDFLKRIEQKYKIIWLADVICDGPLCKASMDGKFIYRDAGHLTYEGSEYLGKTFDFYGRIAAAAHRSE